MNNDTRAADGARGTRALAWLLVVASALAFLPGIFGDFVWDDVNLIVDGPATIAQAVGSSFWSVEEQGLGHVETGAWYYRPVVSAAYVVQRSLFGLEPLGFHLVNVVLHLLCVLLAFRWLVRRGDGSTAGAVAAALGCALFALHPSRPESVTWIAGCTDLWMAFWLLLGLELWDRGSRNARLVALAPFLLAALSKEAAYLAPILLAIDAVALRPAGDRARHLRWVLVPVGAFAAAVAARLAFIPAPPTRALHASFLDGFLQVTTSVGTYVARTVWPWPPSVQVGLLLPDGTRDYPLHLVVLGAGIVVAAIALPIAAWRNEKLRPALADFAWFAVPLLPVCNILPLDYQVLVADRFLYLPMLGVAALVARAVRPLLERADRRRAVTVATVGAVAGLCGIGSTVHVGHFFDNVALWRHEVSLAPGHPRLLLRLCDALWANRQLEEASARCVEAFGTAQDDPTRLLAATNWAAIRSELTGDQQQEELIALRDFYEAVANDRVTEHTLRAGGQQLRVPLGEEGRNWMRSRPAWAANRALLWARTGRLDAARGILEEIVAKQPSADAFADLIRVVAQQEDWETALRIAAAAKERYPLSNSVRTTAALVERLAARDMPASGAFRDAERAYRWIELDNPRLARSLLAPRLETAPAVPELVSLAINAELRLSAWTAARQLVRDARQAAPESEAYWKQFEQRIDDAERARAAAAQTEQAARD